MVATSRPWYNGSYTMAVKPIKSLELYYTMIQFLIIPIILVKISQFMTTRFTATDTNSGPATKYFPSSAGLVQSSK